MPTLTRLRSWFTPTTDPPAVSAQPAVPDAVKDAPAPPAVTATPVVDVVDVGRGKQAFVDAPKEKLADALADIGAPHRQAVRTAVSDALSIATNAPNAPNAPNTTNATNATNAAVAGPPSIHKLYGDPQFKALYDFCIANVQHVEHDHLDWDKLGAARSFAAAVQFVMNGTGIDGAPVDEAGSLLTRFGGVQERRALTHLLLLLMPPSDRTERPLLRDGARGAAQDLFRPFPEAVVVRADDDFALKPGDLPNIAPIFTAHLSADLSSKIFQVGQRGLFLASKQYCPGAFLQDRKDKNPPTLPKTQQSGHEGDPILVCIDDVVMQDGVKMAKVHVPEQHKAWLWDDGSVHNGDVVLPRLDTVTGVDGVSTGAPIMIPVAHLEKYLLAEGDGSRGLNLDSAEDRALALTFADTLKSTWLTDGNGYAHTLFDWLQTADERTPPHDVDKIREQVREAAFQSVVRFTTHPRRTHFTLDVDPARNDWQKEALAILNGTGIVRDQGNYYEKDKSGSTAHVHELAWTGEILRSGFIGGSLDCLGSSDAYDKLSKTFLEPMGVVAMMGIAEGHGASLVRVLSQPDANGVVQAGVPMKVKPNELIVGLDMPLSSGRGPAAQYMENWGGYLRIHGPLGTAIDFAASQRKLAATLAALS